MTEYLDLPLRSLEDLAGETEAELATITARQEALLERKTIADLELRFEEAEALGEEHDRLDGRRATLDARIDTLKDEIAYRLQPRFDGGAP